jgi:hypothetical protein
VSGVRKDGSFRWVDHKILNTRRCRVHDDVLRESSVLPPGVITMRGIPFIVCKQAIKADSDEFFTDQCREASNGHIATSPSEKCIASRRALLPLRWCRDATL